MLEKHETLSQRGQINKLAELGEMPWASLQEY